MKKLTLMLLVIVAGCASMAHDGGVYESSDYQFSVEIPDGWRKLDTEKYFLITKDGPFLQYALIQQRPIDRPFKHTQKKLNKGMLPQEVADIIVDEIASDRNILSFQVIENAPAIIDGHEGFKILFTYSDKKGSTFKMLYYGFLNGDSFYNLRYNAAVRHYFEKDITAFEKILSSFKLIEDKTT